MFASNAALIYIPYPTQVCCKNKRIEIQYINKKDKKVLAKSCKPIPVMIVGFVFLKKNYKLLEWFFVFLIVAGISLFLFKDVSGNY